MEQRLRESLSALMDDEANELELERILANIGEDGELRGTWVRYNAVRSLVSGQSAVDTSLDISGRVQRALSGEVIPPVALAGRIPGLLRPAASLAVAASVAAVVVVGGLQIRDMQAVGTDQPLVAVSPPGMVGTVGATPVRASFGGQPVPVLQPATHTAYRELARQRMQRYMQEHAEAAALNTPQGLIPFARVNEIRE
jgi:sigma-E factor negative regulatory protein RseA